MVYVDQSFEARRKQIVGAGSAPSSAGTGPTGTYGAFDKNRTKVIQSISQRQKTTPVSPTQPVIQQQPTQQISVWQKLASDIKNASSGILSSVFGPKKEIISPIADSAPPQAQKPVATQEKSTARKVTEFLFPMTKDPQKEIEKVQDYLAKNYDSAITKSLAYVQQKVEKDYKEKPGAKIMLGIVKGVTGTFIGSTKAFQDYYNQEMFVPKDTFGKTQMAIGQMIATVMTWHYAGLGLKSIGAAKATLPLLFSAVGQLSLPMGSTIERRIKRLSNDAITGWLFGKVPFSEKLVSVKTVTGAGLSGSLLYSSEVADKLTEGMGIKEAAETSWTAFLIAALFHTINVAYSQFTSAKFLEKGDTFTPNDLRARAEGAPKASKATFEKMAAQAEALGKDIKIEVIASKESPAAKVFGKGAVEAITGKPQEIKLKSGEGTDYILRVEFVDAKGKLPGEAGKPGEPKAPAEPKAPTPETIKKAFLQKADRYTSAKDLAQGEYGQKSTAQIGFMPAKLISARDPIDRAAVDQYKADIEAGKDIEPIIISRENGVIETTDGSHRLVAYQELDRDAPVIFTGKEKIEGLTTFEEAYEPPAKAPDVGGKPAPVTPEGEKKQLYDYQSTQLDIPADIAKDVTGFAAKIPDEQISVDPDDPTIGREKAPHITVAYGLSKDVTEEMIREVIADQKPIEVTLGKTSIFENEKYDVLKVDVTSPELTAINKRIEDELGLPGKTFDGYEPHITIAYLKKGEGQQYAGDASLEGKKITLDTLTFSKTTGETMEIPLSGIASKPEDVTPSPAPEKPPEVTTEPSTKQPNAKKAPAKAPKVKEERILKRILSKKPQLPIMGNVAVRGGVATASDLEIYVEIPMKKPDGIYRFIGDDMVLQKDSLEDFPQTPKAEKPVGKILPDTIKDVLDQVLPSAATDESRPMLTAVHVEIGEGVGKAVTTDGYRLFHKTFALKVDNPVVLNIAVPDKLNKAMEALTDATDIKIGEDLVEFAAGDRRIVVKTIAGEYPQIHQVTDRVQFTKAWTVNAKEVQVALKSLAPYTKVYGATPGIRLQFAEGEVKLTAGAGNETKTVSVKASPKDMKSPAKLPDDYGFLMPMRLEEAFEKEDAIGINIKFLSDMITQVGAKDLDLGFAEKEGQIDPYKPMVMTAYGELNPGAPVKAEKQPESPAYEQGGNGAAIGGFAVLENLTGKGNTPPELPSFRIVPFPEIVRMVKNLTGKYPKIATRRMGLALGRAYSGDLGIKLRASIFQDADLAAKVLSHELGHIMDYLPEGMRRKGNLLSRIASLNGYLKTLLAEFPGGEIITEKDRKRLRKEAEALAEKPVTETKEVVVGEKLPTPEEILEIWNTNTAGISNPELLSYIQKLSTELKVDLVKAAVKRTVPKWVTFKKQVKETITAGVIRNAPADIRKLYEKLLKEEILKRRLFDLKVIKQELRTLSAEWRPFDRLKSSPNYVKYRDTPSELYADAISVLLNDPERLKLSAPEFYRGFFNYLGQKPEVNEAYMDIQRLLNRGDAEVNKERLEDIYKGYEEGAKRRRAAFERELDTKSLAFKFATQVVTKFHPIYVKLNQAIKEGKITMTDKQAVRETLEEMAMARNDIWLDLERNEQEVMRVIKDAGVEEKQLGAWFELERNLSERMGLANPGGLIGEFNKEVKNFLEKSLTPVQVEAIKKAAEAFHKATFEIVEQMYNEGMIQEKVYKERILPFKDTYVTYGVVKYIEKDYVSPHVKSMTGTLEQIENPLVTTMYKRASMLQAIAVHKGKKSVISFLKDHYPDEVTKTRSILSKSNQRIFQKDPEKGQIMLMENGKWASYDVDPYFEDMFKSMKPRDLFVLVDIVGKFNRIFKPLVTTYKLGWAIYSNPMKDIQRTMRNLAAISKIEGVPFDRKAFLKEWITTFPEAGKFATGKLTPFAKMAIGEKAISSPWGSYDPTGGEDKALETLYQKYRFETGDKPGAAKRVMQKLLTPIEMVLKALEITGGTFESTTKLAAFKYLSKRLEDTNQVAFYTRNYTGTPNYTDGGRMKLISNNIWVFSNVIVQGMRSNAELGLNPKSRGAFAVEIFLQTGMWVLLMLAGASGFLGKQIKEMYDKMNEYHKTNYLSFPMTVLDSGRAFYFTIPQDEVNRMVGAIIWKTGMALQGRLIKPFQLVDIGAGVFPTVSPIFDIIGAWVDYISGKNPYDSFYGRNVLDQQTATIRGSEGLKKMFLWTVNQVGLGNFATYEEEGRNVFEKFIQYAPGINRMFRSSDYGLTEIEKELERVDLRDRAIQNKKEADLVKKYADEYRKEGGDSWEYFERLTDELYPEGVQNKEERANLKRLNKDFEKAILGQKDDPRIRTVTNLQLNSSKIRTLQKYREEMDGEEYDNLLNTLLEEGAISKTVYVETAR